MALILPKVTEFRIFLVPSPTPRMKKLQNRGGSFIQNSLLAYKEEGCCLEEFDTEYFCRVIFLEDVGVSVMQKDSLTYRIGWGSAKKFLGESK